MNTEKCKEIFYKQTKLEKNDAHAVTKIEISVKQIIEHLNLHKKLFTSLLLLIKEICKLNIFR